MWKTGFCLKNQIEASSDCDLTATKEQVQKSISSYYFRSYKLAVLFFFPLSPPLFILWTGRHQKMKCVSSMGNTNIPLCLPPLKSCGQTLTDIGPSWLITLPPLSVLLWINISHSFLIFQNIFYLLLANINVEDWQWRGKKTKWDYKCSFCFF